MYYSIKKYDHNVGLSCCFRQWRATSHCSKLHGYPLAFTFHFKAEELDGNNWVIDFGGMKSLKSELEHYFDHKTLVATDDPHIEWYLKGHELGTIDLIVIGSTGCEKVAEFAFGLAEDWLKIQGYDQRVSIDAVKVEEHSGNSAVYCVCP